ncbi:MAG TPA: hypothetical protein VNO30_26500 [Kofleriaceae bacterium]|nr:hypothetical protein [Kofleriaceae bacterium]
MFQRGELDDPEAHIGRATVTALQRELDERVTTPKEGTEIDLWLESPGGDAHAAYKLVLDLRARARRLRVVIPDYAKSAATLIALGMDEIFMSPAAELGPLDVQIEHPDREGLIVSALDVAGALDFLGRTAVTLTLTGGASVLQATKLPRSEVLRDMLTFSAEFVRPAVNKLDPHLLHRASKELRVAEKYAEALLKETQHHHALNIAALVRALVENYPAHGFVISRDEAARLKLPIRPAETLPRWPLIRLLHQRSENVDESFIFVADEQMLDTLASKLQADDDDDDDATNDAEEEKEDGGNDETKANDAEPKPASPAPIIAERDRSGGSRADRGGPVKPHP